jgi:hypothetical protein
MFGMFQPLLNDSESPACHEDSGVFTFIPTSICLNRWGLLDRPPGSAQQTLKRPVQQAPRCTCFFASNLVRSSWQHWTLLSAPLCQGITQNRFGESQNIPVINGTKNTNTSKLHQATFSANTTTHDFVLHLPVLKIWTEYSPVDVHCTTNTCHSFSSHRKLASAALVWRSNPSKLKVSNKPECPTDPVLP